MAREAAASTCWHVLVHGHLAVNDDACIVETGTPFAGGGWRLARIGCRLEDGAWIDAVIDHHKPGSLGFQLG